MVRRIKFTYFFLWPLLEFESKDLIIFSKIPFFSESIFGKLDAQRLKFSFFMQSNGTNFILVIKNNGDSFIESISKIALIDKSQLDFLTLFTVLTD